jgi:hypothetical protein
VEHSLGLRNVPDILGPDVRVALELVPGLVEREPGDLVDLVAPLKERAGRLVGGDLELYLAVPRGAVCKGLGFTMDDPLADPRRTIAV